MLDMVNHALQVLAALDISGLPRTPATDSTIKIVLNVALVIAGAIAVLMVVISGFRFITSQGNPSEIAKARNAIIFSIAGLLIMIFAFSLVNFVIFRVT